MDRIQPLRNVYFVVVYCSTWYVIHEATLATWNDFHRQLQETLSTKDRRVEALRLLESPIQKRNKSVPMSAEDMAHLFRQADPAISEPKNPRNRTYGVNEQQRPYAKPTTHRARFYQEGHGCLSECAGAQPSM